MATRKLQFLLAHWLLILASISAEVECEKCETRKYLLALDYDASKLVEIDMVSHETRILLERTNRVEHFCRLTVDSTKRSPVIYATNDINDYLSVQRITFDEYSEPQPYTLPLREDMKCWGIATCEVNGTLYCGDTDHDMIWEITNNSAKKFSFKDPANMKCRGGYLYISCYRGAIIYRYSIPLTSTAFAVYQRAAILSNIEDFFVDESYLYWLETNRKNSSMIFQRDLSHGYIRQLPPDTTRKVTNGFTIDSGAGKLYYSDMNTAQIFECVTFQSQDNCTIITKNIKALRMEVFSHRHCDNGSDGAYSQTRERKFLKTNVLIALLSLKILFN